MLADDTETRWGTKFWLPWSISEFEGHICFLFVIAATNTFNGGKKYVYERHIRNENLKGIFLGLEKEFKDCFTSEFN